MGREFLWSIAIVILSVVLSGCGSTSGQPVATATPVPIQSEELPEQPTETPLAKEAYSLAFSRYSGAYDEEFALTMAAAEETAEILSVRQRSIFRGWLRAAKRRELLWQL